jgi:RecG-like helicase
MPSTSWKSDARLRPHEADILVATTIIESGSISRTSNTIFIDQADKYGLADLHQLRGRVGAYKHRAYAYLLLDRARPAVTPNAVKRDLKAIEEFTELGAGFKIALRDLEIRGAGNILSGVARSIWSDSRHRRVALTFGGGPHTRGQMADRQHSSQWSGPGIRLS